MLWLWWVEVRDDAKHLTTHRTDPPQRVIQPQMPMVEAEKCW